MRTGGLHFYSNCSALYILPMFYSFEYQYTIICSDPPLFSSMAWHQSPPTIPWEPIVTKNQTRINIQEEEGEVEGWWVIDTRLRGVYQKAAPKSMHIYQFFCQWFILYLSYNHLYHHLIICAKNANKYPLTLQRTH